MQDPFLGFMEYHRKDLEFHNPCREGVRKPSAAKSSLRPQLKTKSDHLHYLIRSVMWEVFVQSSLFALLTSILGSLLFLQNTGVTHNMGHDIANILRPSVELVDDFKFLPTFLLCFVVSKDASRWVEWLDVGFSIQGRIHDIALAIGSAMGESSEWEGVMEVKYTFFRYLSAAHYIHFMKVDSRIPDDPVDCCAELESVGLLTAEEARHLPDAGPMMRDRMFHWISCLIKSQIQKGAILPTSEYYLFEKLSYLRAITATFHDLRDCDQPSALTQMVRVVLEIFLFLVVIAYPIKWFQTDHCFQLFTLVSSLLVHLSYRGLWKVWAVLRPGPFDMTRCDCANIDDLLCYTDITIFQYLCDPAPLTISGLLQPTTVDKNGPAFFSPPAEVMHTSDCNASCLDRVSNACADVPDQTSRAQFPEPNFPLQVSQVQFTMSNDCGALQVDGESTATL